MNFKIITVDFGINSSFVNKDFEHINFNFEDGLPNLPVNILSNAVVIVADVIEHLIEPQKFINNLSMWARVSPYILISTPDRNRVRGLGDYGPPQNTAHVREWSLQEFYELLAQNGIKNFLIGYTENNDILRQKVTILAICGYEISFSSQEKKKILAIVNCYNEKDIIIETINHLLSQDIDVCVVDNNSNDGTFEIINHFFINNNRVCIRQSENYGNTYEWYKLLCNTEKISHEFSLKYDWFMHNDADEIRNAPISNITLNDMISFVDNLGYNALDFTVLDFRFTKNNDSVESNFEKNLLSFEFGRNPGHFQQVKAWKYSPNINLCESGGHDAKFPNRKIYPINFLTKHYPLRSYSQAIKKIYQDRITRIAKEQKERGWHAHYDKYIKGQANLNFNEYQLIRWHQNIFDTEFLVERISRIGI